MTRVIVNEVHDVKELVLLIIHSSSLLSSFLSQLFCSFIESTLPHPVCSSEHYFFFLPSSPLSLSFYLFFSLFFSFSFLLLPPLDKLNASIHSLYVLLLMIIQSDIEWINFFFSLQFFSSFPLYLIDFLVTKIFVLSFFNDRF